MNFFRGFMIFVMMELLLGCRSVGYLDLNSGVVVVKGEGGGWEVRWSTS